MEPPRTVSGGLMFARCGAGASPRLVPLAAIMAALYVGGTLAIRPLPQGYLDHLHTALLTAATILAVVAALQLHGMAQRDPGGLARLATQVLWAGAATQGTHLFAGILWDDGIRAVLQRSTGHLLISSSVAASYVPAVGLIGARLLPRLPLPVKPWLFGSLLFALAGTLMTLAGELPWSTWPAVARPEFAGAIPLWGAVALLYGRDAVHRLAPALCAMALFFLVADVSMLSGSGAHDGPVMVSHLGYVLGYLLLVLALSGMDSRDAGLLRESERRLRESEQRYRTLVEVSPDAIFVNRDNRVVLVNAAGVHLFGATTADELLGRSPLALFHPDFHPLIQARITAILMTGRPAPLVENRIVRVDGSVAFVEVAATPFEDKGTIAIQVVLRDITGRRQAEEQIRQLNAQLEQRVAQRTAELKAASEELEFFFTLSLDMVCIARTDGYFKRLNPAFEQVLGHSAAELMSRPFVEWVHPDDVAPTMAELRKLAGGAPTLDFENRYRCRDGTYKWLSWRVQPRADGTLYALARDVTERRHLFEQLQERALEARVANEAKSRFLAVMSHEIRTPLVGVLGMLDVLAHSRMDDAQRRQFNIVRQSAGSLLELIGDILDYSKIEAGKMELVSETFSTRDLVSRVVAGFSSAATSKGLDLIHDVAEGVAPSHVGDPIRLRQILANLVGNAIKFTSRGSVALRLEAVPAEAGRQRLMFHVADTGIGMDSAQVERLFQPFVQADQTTARRFGGTGLGLSISRRLADLIGAQIRVESTVGRGTTMHLELTLTIGNPANLSSSGEAQEEPVSTRPTPSREAAEREGSLLLLAEDHPTNRLVLSQQLELAGFAVDSADTGQIALQKFASTNYGLVLTDLHMPGLDGFQLAAAIRDVERTRGQRRTPVIALTANVLKEDMERCFASGMDDYLAKPVTVRQLVQKLRQWLPGLEWAAGAAVPAQPGSPAAGGETGAVDLAAVARFTGAEGARAWQILNQYAAATADDLAALALARDRGPPAVAGIAHRMKGAALVVGAQEIAERAQAVEQAARRGDETAIDALTGDLKAAFARLEQILKQAPG